MAEKDLGETGTDAGTDQRGGSGKAGSHKSSTAAIGRTLADILDSVLDKPARAWPLLCLIVTIAGVIVVTTWALMQILQVQASDVTIGSKDSHVVFQSVHKLTGNHEFVVIVSPEGWQNTGIDIHSGDKISFAAGGKICIDMNSIWEKVQLRKQYEDAIAKAHNILRDTDKETRVPEDYFTDAQKKSLILDRPWVNPDGFSLDKFQPSFRSRRNRYILPDKPAGGLIASITAGTSEPSRQDAFFVGREHDLVSDKDGQLWFNVNDVTYGDPQNQNLFFNDNVGSFWVHMTVKSK
jgi:hypothetical protein